MSKVNSSASVRLVGVSLVAAAAVFPFAEVSATPGGAPGQMFPAVPNQGQTASSQIHGEAWPHEIIDQGRRLLDEGRPVTAADLLAGALAEGAVAGDEAVLLTARAYAEHRAWPAVIDLLADRELSSAASAVPAGVLLAEAFAGTGDAQRAAEHYGKYLAAAEAAGVTPPVSVRMGLVRALVDDDRWAEGAAQLVLVGAENPTIAGWTEVSRLNALIRAEDEAAFALAESIIAAGDAPGASSLERVRADSAREAAAGFAFERDRPRQGADLLSGAPDRVVARLVAAGLGQHLLSTEDTEGATAAYRLAVGFGRDLPETGPALAGLDPSWETLREIGLANQRAGRHGPAEHYLSQVLELAPYSARREVAAELTQSQLARGRLNAAAETLSTWINYAPDQATAELWVLAARLRGARGQTARRNEAYRRAAALTGSAAARAAYLLADMADDAGRTAEAAAGYKEVADRFRDHDNGMRSLERAAMLAFGAGNYPDARDLLAQYTERYPDEDWAEGATYWRGRAEEALGNADRAQADYTRTLEMNPRGFYAAAAAGRLGRARWDELSRQLDPDLSVPALDRKYAAAIDRMNLLKESGWPHRAQQEYDAVRDAGPDDAAHTMAFAMALHERGWHYQGILQAWRSYSAQPRWSLQMLKAIYPLPHAEAYIDEATKLGLSPHHVVGVSRRESMFDAGIRSAANAWGLMQLLPETAAATAPRAGLPDYSRAQLTVPEVNIKLGVSYLAEVLDRFDGVFYAGLISYNAGPHRYERWRNFPEFGDNELLVERIPYKETREYVRAVSSLADIYQFLYPELR